MMNLKNNSDLLDEYEKQNIVWKIKRKTTPKTIIFCNSLPFSVDSDVIFNEYITQ